MFTFAPGSAMAFSDFLILDAIRALSDEDNLLTYAEIALRLPTPCSTRTVLRSVQRLEKLGCLVRSGSGPGWGYCYEIVETPPEMI